ncbi:MAG: DUF1932 domain-containing protein [Pantoea sp.]|uniref:NAD(P)-dependent oxidoreductase n=1 Tax=Pantoea sp. TaxID=69393 RepID=UPI0023A0EA6C|nr:DUF1932 domain-containing protein [Pantoea sp.]MDE1186456.1 DUF1932 domain-containing protein [Pantoea sp.]
MTKIAIIGFGEAGRIYAKDLAAQGAQVTVWDNKFLSAEADQLKAMAGQWRVRAAHSLALALEGATLVLSLVTAANALQVAQQAAALLRQGQTLLDFNSVAPDTKRAAAQAVTEGEGGYLDVAVMAPVPPKRLGTPLLIGGTQAATVAALLSGLGCQARAASEEIGTVSAIKMCRSVMIKGLEALTTECLAAAQRYGVEEAVLNSLHTSFPSLGWNDALPDYLISRVAEHGVRRAEEMQEVVKTLQDVGLEAPLSRAIRQVQAELPAQLKSHQLQYQDLVPFSWRTVLAKLSPKC